MKKSPERYRNNKFSSPYLWAFTTYFTEGFPYTIIRTVSSVFFRHKGMSLEGIGLTSLFALPWIIKFLWSPHVDEFGTKRRWLLCMQGSLVALFILTACLVPLSISIQVIAALFFIGSFLAATHDIAIDGYYMEALDSDGQAKFVGYRVMAYRIAMMTGTGIIVTIGAKWNWPLAFAAAALAMAALYIFHLYALPHCETQQRPLGHAIQSLNHKKFITWAICLGLAIIGLRLLLASELYLDLQTRYPLMKRFTFSAWISLLLFSLLVAVAFCKKRIKKRLTDAPDSFYAKAFLVFMDRKNISAILAFIILIRAGEFMLSAMVAPFIVDLGIMVHYGWISGGVGLPCSIIGALLGGWFISKYSLRKMALPFLLAQNLTNIVYMVLALSVSSILEQNTGNPTPVPVENLTLATIALVHGFDQFAGGLGTAILMTYLMRICDVKFKAAHYAIGTGLMSVSGLYAGVLSGFLASWLGYGNFFGVSFLCSIPGMIMLKFIPFFDSKPIKTE